MLRMPWNVLHKKQWKPIVSVVRKTLQAKLLVLGNLYKTLLFVVRKIKGHFKSSTY